MHVASHPFPSTPAKAPKRRRRQGAGLAGFRRPEGPRSLNEQTLRQCRICRTQKSATSLLALGAEMLVGDGSAHGRHAYVCLERACIARLGKSLGSPAQAEAFLQHLCALALTRVGQAAGLARRQSLVVFGASRICDHPRPFGPGTVILVASDCALRTWNQLRTLPYRPWRLPWTQPMLGRSIGQNDIAAVAIMPSRHARQAAYWLQVCYEAQPDAGQIVVTDATDDGIEVVR